MFCEMSSNLPFLQYLQYLYFFSLFFSGLICKVSAGNDNAYLTTNHLATLGKLEPSVVSLVIAFRYWAKVSVIFIPPPVKILNEGWYCAGETVHTV